MNDKDRQKAKRWGLWGLTLLWAIPIAIAVPGAIPQGSAKRHAQSPEPDRLLQQGFVQSQQGQWDAAVASWQSALQGYRNARNQDGEARALGSLANAFQALGRYADAIASANAARQLWQQLQNRTEEGKVIGNLGNIYIELGNYKKAKELHEQSLAIARESNNAEGEVRTLISLGAIAGSEGDYEAAKRNYQQALTKATAIGYTSARATALNNLGSAYHALGQYQEAIARYQQTLELAETLNSPRFQSAALAGLGLAHANLQDYDRALQYQERGWKLAEQMNSKPLASIAAANWGFTLWKARRLPEAENKLREAIAIRESLRLELNDLDRVSLFDTQARDYSLLQQVLIAQNKPEAALEVSERGRARAFVELLAQRLSDSNIAAAANVEPPSLPKVQEIARQQQATLVEYSIISDEQFVGQGKLKGKPIALYIWVVQPTGKVTFRSVDLKNLELPLEEIIKRSRRAVVGRGINQTPVGDKQSTPERRRPTSQFLGLMYQLLIAPIEDLLPTDPEARIIAIPHQTLFLVPFAALQDKTGTYAIEKHTFAIAPSIQVLDFTHQQKERLLAQTSETREDLVVGNPTMPSFKEPDGTLIELSPLPGAETEAQQIAQQLKTEPLIGNSATEIAVRERLGSAHLVHLATHGLLDDFGTGIPGAIALAPSGDASTSLSLAGDGLLTAEELLGLKIRAELVVLSACDTGRGEITGDGVIGLSRSLIVAGAPSILVSLWAVPDAPTAELMVEFYRQLALNPDKAKALRLAMLATLKKYDKPVNWAAFTLVGEAE
ncbi:CHAT domain-containing tetratricopeptide repeat protein [Oscillatoria sp. FACHB-1406]|uniref:CHAT domain-containing protein n=1 Tax=Oscillatoria sp. FACHB-1406 TaxID=2692846 RepID=UPI00168414C5|nr:CHAT domain-containing tetratricopeptide repeat protein [Oscillatoria sp. FACHB-1406]MBD2577387.1 CHAT domain-containing protein [Oscillatoria sp. FACHB-1406]